MSQPTTQWPVAQPVVPLEQRLEQLEATVAALPDVHALEERIVERISQHLQTTASAKAERLASAQLPTSAPLVTPAASAASQAPRTIPPLVPAPPAAARFPGLAWLMIDICREALAIFWMFIDLNYKVAWSTRVLALILLPAILTSQWWDWPLAGIPLVGGFLDKLLDLVLAFVMFKALSREAHKYMEARNSS